MARTKSNKLCECGCGRRTFIALKSVKASGVRRGEPLRFIAGHAFRSGPKYPTYMSWAGMKQRCLYKGHVRYKHYGGRGISICRRWIKFENFLSDMGYRPPGTSLDRIDNDGDYEPGNCRWTTDEVQARNKDTGGTMITAFGETKCIAAWAKDYRCVANYAALCKRITKYKWPVKKALTTPLQKRKPRIQKYTTNLNHES